LDKLNSFRPCQKPPKHGLGGPGKNPLQQGKSSTNGGGKGEKIGGDKAKKVLTKCPRWGKNEVLERQAKLKA